MKTSLSRLRAAPRSPLPLAKKKPTLKKEHAPAGRVVHRDALKLPPLPDKAARELNLLACPHRLPRNGEQTKRFGVDISALPRAAEVYVCDKRTDARPGILYIKDFLSPAELRELMGTWPSEEELFSPENCNADQGELMSWIIKERRNNVTEGSLTMLDNRIRSFTRLHVGKFAHKRYDVFGYGETFNNLHHDANGACCGLAKRSLARVMTLLL